MSTTSDFKVKIEKLKGPDDWRKWKWQILILLCAHCLEGSTDGSQKCPVLPADVQPQQNKRHVMKVLKQHDINVEANKEFCDGCALGKAHRQSFGT